jgi:hypothetical protein
MVVACGGAPKAGSVAASSATTAIKITKGTILLFTFYLLLRIE